MKTDPNGFPHTGDHLKLMSSVRAETKFIVTYRFWCPGCKNLHPFRVYNPDEDNNSPVWDFNKDLDNPTFSPSLGLRKSEEGGFDCHLFLENGKLRFLNDCEHELAGKTVPLPDLPEDPWDAHFNSN